MPQIILYTTIPSFVDNQNNEPKNRCLETRHDVLVCHPATNGHPASYAVIPFTIGIPFTKVIPTKEGFIIKQLPRSLA
jgi:hypothetical protein